MGARHYFPRNLANNSAFDNAYSAFLNTLSVGGEPTPSKPIRDFSESELFFLQNAGFSDLINIPQGNFTNEVPSIVGDSLIVTGGGNGSLFNASGNLVTGLPADRPRVTFDPVTGEYLGAYFENQDTNGLTFSEDFSVASYNKTNLTVNTDVETAPDGTLTFDRIIDNAVNGFHSIFKTGNSVTIGETSIFSFFIKKSSMRWICIFLNAAGNKRAYFDLDNGVFGFVDIGCTVTSYYVGNGIYHISISAVNTSNLLTIAIELANDNNVNQYSGTGTDGQFIWGAELKENNTSYIKTTTTSVTRTADVFTATGAISGASYGIFTRDQLGKRIDYYHDGNKFTYRNGALEATVVEAPSTDLVIDTYTGSDTIKTIALRLGTMTTTELENITAL